MSLLDLIFKNSADELVPLSDIILQMKANKLNVKEFAINKAAGMIAKVIAKSEFQVVSKDKTISSELNDMYYMLNVRPNPNYDGTSFWFKAILTALTNTEGCLIIMIRNEGIYIADTFTPGKSALNAKTVSGVEVDGYKLNKTFSMNDCLLLKVGDNKIINLLNTFYSEIGEMLGYAAHDFKVKNSKKWRLSLPSSGAKIKDTSDGNKEFTIQEYANMIANKLSDGDTPVIALPENIKIEGISGDETKTSQDFRDLMKSAIESVAMAYDIPLDIFTGNKTDKSTSVKDFITFAIDPVFEMVEDQINAKWLTKEEYIKGTKVKIDKTRIQHVDFFDTADAEIKLILAGYSHNDLRRAKGLEEVDEPWAKKRGIGVNNGKGGTNGQNVST